MFAVTLHFIIIKTQNDQRCSEHTLSVCDCNKKQQQQSENGCENPNNTVEI